MCVYIYIYLDEIEMQLIPLQASDNSRRLGIAVLESIDVFRDKNWYWIGAGAVLGFAVLFNILFTFSLMYLTRKFCQAKFPSFFIRSLVSSS